MTGFAKREPHEFETVTKIVCAKPFPPRYSRRSPA